MAPQINSGNLFTRVLNVGFSDLSVEGFAKLDHLFQKYKNMSARMVNLLNKVDQSWGYEKVRSSIQKTERLYTAQRGKICLGHHTLSRFKIKE